MQNYKFAGEKSNLQLMSKLITLNKGLNINLYGDPDKVYASVSSSKKYIVKPTDFFGLTPKMKVKVGDSVKAGSVLFYDKCHPRVNYCSPVSGIISDIVRGNKRKILEVIINAEDQINYKYFPVDLNKKFSREEIIEKMLESGIWPFIRQKPYDIVANPDDTPKAIFISAFNSAPITIDNDFALYGMDDLFQKGIDYIKKLTNGITHLNIDGSINPSKIFSETKGVQINKINGPHPAGNVGVQIHHIDPINKGDVVWYLEPQDVLAVGRLFNEGKYDVSRIVALSGSQVLKPRYYRLISGARIDNILANNLKEGDNRVISGDVLTGDTVGEEGALGFYHTNITVIEEGKNQEFLGWMKPGFDKFSASRTFFSWLTPKKRYVIDGNMHGEERAYVMTGQYESVLPMDIYPMHLIKAIMIEDIDLMEQLGIYEVSPQDLALCEFVCTSKINVQEIIRTGLDLVRKENS